MNAIGKFIKSLQIDTRLLGMIGALLVIWIVFDVVTGGLYLTPRNLFNLSVQTASVAVMATGMVFIIVTRHIDLSVGSLLGFLGMLMGTMQLHVLPEIVGTGHWSIWIITVIFGVVMGALIGAFQGWLVGYLTIPAFIVTLGELLVWRGAAWWVTSGQTVAPLDQTFKLLGGGVSGTPTVQCSSWKKRPSVPRLTRKASASSTATIESTAPNRAWASKRPPT